MDIVYSKFDSSDDIQRKLERTKHLLTTEEGKKLKDRSMLFEAYLAFSVKVFERDLASRA